MSQIKKEEILKADLRLIDILPPCLYSPLMNGSQFKCLKSINCALVGDFYEFLKRPWSLAVSSDFVATLEHIKFG